MEKLLLEEICCAIILMCLKEEGSLVIYFHFYLVVILNFNLYYRLSILLYSILPKRIVDPEKSCQLCA